MIVTGGLTSPMKKTWSIDEIILKLPFVNIKLKAPQPGSESQRDAEGRIVLDGALGVKVALRSFNGSFVTADLNMNGALLANRPRLDDWERFELFKLPDGKVSLRAWNGKFVGAKIHEQCQLVADLPHVRDWETFRPHRLPDAKFAFQAFNGLYVSADLNRDGKLVADRPEASGWEAFTLLPAD